MLRFNGSPEANRRRIVELAVETVETANRNGAGVLFEEAHGLIWLSSGESQILLDFGLDGCAVFTDTCEDLGDYAHLYVVCAEILDAWKQDGLCTAVRDPLAWVEGGRDILALLRTVMQSLGTRLVWPTDFMFRLIAAQ